MFNMIRRICRWIIKMIAIGLVAAIFLIALMMIIGVGWTLFLVIFTGLAKLSAGQRPQRQCPRGTLHPQSYVNHLKANYIFEEKGGPSCIGGQFGVYD